MPESSFSAACEGPFVWFSCTDGAILLCARCQHLTVTGNFNDVAHAATPVLTEGLAS